MTDPVTFSTNRDTDENPTALVAESPNVANVGVAEMDTQAQSAQSRLAEYANRILSERMSVIDLCSLQQHNTILDLKDQILKRSVGIH